MGALLDQYKMRPGEPRWGSGKYNPALDAIEASLGGKAPLNGSWYEGAFAAGVGLGAEAPTEASHAYAWLNTTPMPPALELRDGAGAVLATVATREWLDLRPRQLSGLLADPVSAESARTDSDLGAARFANSGAYGWGHFEPWLDGAAWRVQLEGMMSTGEAANAGLSLWYQVFGPGDPVILVKRRWQASQAYSLGDTRIPTSPNGSYYQVTTAGTSGAAEPTWPASGTVSDGTAVWTRMGPGLIALSALSLTPPATAYDRFDLDSASLQIPAGAAAVGDRVHFALKRSASDAHSGDLLVNALWIAPVEV